VPASALRPRFAALLRLAAAAAVLAFGPARAGAAVAPYEAENPAGPATRLDGLVEARLAQLGVAPAAACSDAVFLRRAHLDLTGTLPTEPEVRAFLADRSPDRRAALVDRLLATEDFADYWAMRWSDVLRVKAEYPVNLWPNAAQAYHRWIRDAFRTGLPLDRFARDLLTTSGSNFRAGPANFWRAVPDRRPAGLARAVALTFLAARVEAWPPADLEAFARLFGQVACKGTREWKEEIVVFDPSLPAPGPGARFPDGTPARLPPGTDPRAAFADWLLAPENPAFARAVANRAWGWLFGRGISHPVDDLRPGHPPDNPALLDHLAATLVASGYDWRALLREIVTSRTYQRSSLAATDDPRAATAFAFYPPRRMDAEVLLDAVNQVTGGTDAFTSPIPEPFTFVPPGTRAVALADASVTSPFLELFGRSPRDTGEDGERDNTVTAGQRLHLLNSTHLQRKLEQGPALAALLRGPDPVERLYLAILSRPPTDAERALAQAHLQRAAPGATRRAGRDLAWALLNSPEFQLRH
jgi:hypothetical protein